MFDSRDLVVCSDAPDRRLDGRTQVVGTNRFDILGEDTGRHILAKQVLGRCSSARAQVAARALRIS